MCVSSQLSGENVVSKFLFRELSLALFSLFSCCCCCCSIEERGLLTFKSLKGRKKNSNKNNSSSSSTHAYGIDKIKVVHHVSFLSPSIVAKR